MGQTYSLASVTRRVWVATSSPPYKLFSVEVDGGGTIEDLAVAICKRDPSFGPSTSLALYTPRLNIIFIEPRGGVFSRIADMKRNGDRFTRLVESSSLRISIPDIEYIFPVVDVVLDVDNVMVESEDYIWDTS
ncbi:hypothetical protein BDY19DRAFT_991867 [Irpex rosettiformis]|uniref:Uncharacterized protein n=1 Tax=Irpex rosettiformis TaxID=378272 RepID=A0ACB8UBF5_9APHY|nr:hypothetical protein BDY19DRAFT_991867 [Irpex rosettiformis]